MYHFIFCTLFLSYLVTIQGQIINNLQKRQHRNGNYLSLFSFFNEMTPEQFKGLQKLIDLGVLSEDIREPINILRNLPVKVFYPNLPKNMKRLVPFVLAITNLDMEEIKTILKLKYHGALTNNVLSMIVELNSLNDEQLKTFQNILKNESINTPLDLLNNLRIFFLLKKDRLKNVTKNKDISNLIKFMDGLKPFGFGHINKIIKDFNLEKLLRNKFKSTEKIISHNESSSNQIFESNTTNDLNLSSGIDFSIQEFNFYTTTTETQIEVTDLINKNQTTSKINNIYIIFNN